MGCQSLLLFFRHQTYCMQKFLNSICAGDDFLVGACHMQSRVR